MAIRSGIYMILNLLNGKRYVGSAVNLKRRRQDHFRDLRNGKNGNSHLQYAYNKYGGNAFGWEVLVYVEDLEMLISWENIYLSMYWPTGLLYNNCPMAGTPLGYKHTEEAKQKISKAHKGRCDSAETKQKKREAALADWKNPRYRQNVLNAHVGMTGKHHSAESKRKSSETHKKQWADKEFRQMMFEALNSVECKQKRRETILRLWADEEYYQKMLEIHNSVETRQKKSKAMKKFWAEMSEERRQMVSEALKRGWIHRKQTKHLSVLAQLIGVLRKRLDCLAVIP